MSKNQNNIQKARRKFNREMRKALKHGISTSFMENTGATARVTLYDNPEAEAKLVKDPNNPDQTMVITEDK